MILTALGLACAGCAYPQSAFSAEPARAANPVSSRMERHGANIVIDWSHDKLQSVTLDGNRALTFTGGQPGGRYTLSVTQDATGSRTVTWPADVRWPGGAAPALTTTAGKTDHIVFLYTARGTYDGVAISQDF